MHLVTDFLISIIVGYLAFTNTLATGMTNLFSEPEIRIEQTESPVYTLDALSSLPSRISGALPDVLLRSSEYQQAALGGALGLTGSNTKDPLEAIVNIFCTFTTDSYIRTTTGTGFFIDPDGVIMTNAHVAQFMLLEETEANGKTDCIVRSGNPASPKYHAQLLYIPPSWIQDNSTVMSDEHPIGTGERDYALLFASSAIDNSPLPAQFPALDFDTSLLPVSVVNKPVIAAGYPAGALIKEGASADLIPKKADTSISELYTFGSNYADVFSIRGSDVGVQGSSGGPVLNDEGKVIGVIVTRGDDTVDGQGSLRAITISHVNRTLEEETGFGLDESLGGNLPYRAQVFSEVITPFLLSMLGQTN